LFDYDNLLIFKIENEKNIDGRGDEFFFEKATRGRSEGYTILAKGRAPRIGSLRGCGTHFMRIVFSTDIHHAFGQLGTLIQVTSADLYLIAGDLVCRAFQRYETAWRFMELQQIMAGYRSKEPASRASLKEVAERFCKAGEDDATSARAREYLRLCGKAEAYLQKAYTRLEGVLAHYPGRRIYVLPGNYDMDLDQTALKERNLHLRCIEEGGIRIAGYGGSRVQTPGMPDHLQVPFREEHRGAESWSEAVDFFRSVTPDMLVLHEPPYGYLDALPAYGNAGSPAIRNYVDEGGVSLVLSGHHHEHWGAAYSGSTRFFNPSNFGRAEEVSRVRAGGYFLDLILDQKTFVAASLRRLEKGELYAIVEYRPVAGGQEAIILDEKRYSSMGGTLPRIEHIKPVRALQRIKAYFLGYETPETLDLIKQLREIYREIEKEGMEVAFDLLGSLNFGMAERNSDMDVVVYLRGKDCVLDDVDVCQIPRPLSAVFAALKERQLNVEVCDSLDLDRVKHAIREEDPKDGQLQRFIFYRTVCRPVNLRMIKQVENLLLEREAFRREVEKGLKEYLEILVSSVRHVRSFDKYKRRLRERGITLSQDAEESIRNYLRAQ
jgi:Icc-related predicted phosphoesterase/predicted nucleotidyltransferase